MKCRGNVLADVETDGEQKLTFVLASHDSLLSDRYGRKWPLVANLVVIAVLSLGTGFVKTFPQFLAVRCLFGLGMGGIWGMR